MRVYWTTRGSKEKLYVNNGEKFQIFRFRVNSLTTRFKLWYHSWPYVPELTVITLHSELQIKCLLYLVEGCLSFLLQYFAQFKGQRRHWSIDFFALIFNLLFILKRDRCIPPFVELLGLRAFVRAISPFSVCLAGISLVRLSGLFGRSWVILFVRSFTAFVRSFCGLSFGHMACAFILIAFNLELCEDHRRFFQVSSFQPLRLK